MEFLSASIINNFLKELKEVSVLTKDKNSYYYLKNYNIVDYFIDNWILDKNKVISDYYMGECTPDEFENYNELYSTIRGNLERQMIRYINKCVEKCEELGDYALDF